MKKFLFLILLTLLSLTFVACAPGTPATPDGTTGDGDNKLNLTINGSVYEASLANTAAAKAIATMLPLTLNMSDLNANEKFYYLDSQLPTSSVSVGTINAGDILLYGNNCLVVFYKSFTTSYSYTKIARVTNAHNLARSLGTGSVTITFTA